MRISTSLALVVVVLASSACRTPEAPPPPLSVPKPAPPVIDLGTHSRRVSTSVVEAQRAFDRGLVLAFAFNHGAAEREFREAARLDPKLAMAWWGVALVNGPHINNPAMTPAQSKTAWEALGHAKELAPAASPVEQELVAALGKRYAEMPPPDRKPLDEAYAAAMRDAWHAHPDDADVAALFAESMMDLRPWDYWTHDGAAQPGTDEVVATLEKALAIDPNHPGANHLYIHLVEASSHPERALPAADRLRDLVPGAGHLVHMPAHIYIRTARWADAVTANEKAMEADRIFRASSGEPGFYRIYMAHNPQFLSFAEMMEGRSKRSLDASRQMISEMVGSSRVDLQACKLEYSIVSPK